MSTVADHHRERLAAHPMRQDFIVDRADIEHLLVESEQLAEAEGLLRWLRDTAREWHRECPLGGCSLCNAFDDVDAYLAAHSTRDQP